MIIRESIYAALWELRLVLRVLPARTGGCDIGRMWLQPSSPHCS
jgi:hypothetical protein